MPLLRNDMRGEISVRAAMELTVRQRARSPTRLPHIVHGGRPGHVADFPARFPEAATQIGVLPVEEIAFIESCTLTSASRRASMHAPDTQSTT